MDHSREVASQGFSDATGPRNLLQIRFQRKMSCAAPVSNAAIVINDVPESAGEIVVHKGGISADVTYYPR